MNDEPLWLRRVEALRERLHHRHPVADDCDCLLCHAIGNTVDILLEDQFTYDALVRAPIPMNWRRWN